MRSLHEEPAGRILCSPCNKNRISMPADSSGPLKRLPAAILPAPPGEERHAAVETADPSAPRPVSPVFDQLVKDDKDKAGFIAYGLMEFARRDWEKAFRAERGHAPNDKDIAAFDLGERMPRRLDHYRRLAEALLAESHGAPSHSTGRMEPAQPKPSVRGLIIRLALLGVAVVIAGLLIRVFIVRA
jgi:hypothetical protein